MNPALWAAVLVNFLFWSGLAIGAIVFASLLELTDAAWARPLRPVADRFAAFLPLSLLVYVIAFSVAHTFRWRDAVALTAVYAVALWFCYAPRTRNAIALGLVYAVGFSVIAVDLLMGLEPGWVSTLFPAYAFTANVYGGIAAVAFVAAFVMPAEAMKSVARDLSAIVVGFALMWMYFTWSQFLVIWYGNLPADTSYVIKRLSGGWQTMAWIVFACRCVMPVIVLLTPFGRRQPMLAITATIVVIGFWIECWLLVVPALPGPFADVTTAAVTAAFAVVFAASLCWPWQRLLRRAAPLQSATAATARPNSL
jgi:hypothetical protein